jgi:hypothetical protein
MDLGIHPKREGALNVHRKSQSKDDQVLVIHVYELGYSRAGKNY